MRVEEAKFLKEYVEMADYGDALGWHERNGGNFTYWMKPEDVECVQDQLTQSGEWLPIGTNGKCIFPDQRYGEVCPQYEKGSCTYCRHHTGGCHRPKLSHLLGTKGWRATYQ